MIRFWMDCRAFTSGPRRRSVDAAPLLEFVAAPDAGRVWTQRVDQVAIEAIAAPGLPDGFLRCDEREPQQQFGQQERDTAACGEQDDPEQDPCETPIERSRQHRAHVVAAHMFVSAIT